MSVSNFKDLSEHIGHEVVVVGYRKSDADEYESVSIECEDCYEVLLSFDKDE